MFGWTTPISLRGDDPSTFEQKMNFKECESVKCSGTTMHRSKNKKNKLICLVQVGFEPTSMRALIAAFIRKNSMLPPFDGCFLFIFDWFYFVYFVFVCFQFQINDGEEAGETRSRTLYQIEQLNQWSNRLMDDSSVIVYLYIDQNTGKCSWI